MRCELSIKKALSDCFDFVKFVMIRAKQDNVLRVAASLGYTSMIALVPLIAIALAIFSAFPVFDSVKMEIQNFMFNNLVPGVGKTVETYISSFVGATGKLTTIGVVGLAVTAIMMLSTIEASLNVVFGVKKSRPIVARVLVYWTILTLGPLLLGASFSVSGYIFSLSFLNGDISSYGVELARYVPKLLMMFVLMGVYLFVPYRKIKLKHTFVGAFVAVVLFAVLKKTFGMFVVQGSTYNTLYGALAVIPVLLVWMYLSWAVVIFGAVIVASIPEWLEKRADLNKVLDDFVLNRANFISYSVELISILEKARDEEEVMTSDKLASITDLNNTGVFMVLDILEQQGVVLNVEDDRWVMMKNVRNLSLIDLIQKAGFNTYNNDIENAQISVKLKSKLKELGKQESKILDIKIEEVI